MCIRDSYSALQDARNSVVAQKETILKIAEAYKVRYHDSAEPIGKTSSWDELMNCLDANLYAAERSFYEKTNNLATQMTKPIYVSSGGWHIWIAQWGGDPTVKIHFGFSTF